MNVDLTFEEQIFIKECFEKVIILDYLSEGLDEEEHEYNNRYINSISGKLDIQIDKDKLIKDHEELQEKFYDLTEELNDEELK